VSDATERLSTEEVARRLGVKRETVYAYVSRGLLERHPASTAHDSRFDPEEVERLAERARRPDRSSALEVVVETELTLLEPEGRLSYRGRDAIDLARYRSFEEVVALLWDGAPPTPWVVDGERAGAIEALAGVLRPAAPDADRIAAVVATLASHDPERDSRDPTSVRRAGSEVFAATLSALHPPERGRPSLHAGDRGRPSLSIGSRESTASGGPLRGSTARGEAEHAGGSGRGGAEVGIAGRLWGALASGDGKPRPGQVKALEAALILLADHELAASTFAARVAASAWAGPYRVILAGLGPLGGALHGGAGAAVEALIDEVAAGTDPGAALDARLAAGPVPGFGHRVYRDRDPRADHLLSLLLPDRGRALAPTPGQRTTALAAAGGLLEAAEARGMEAPNVDFALATLVKAHGLRDGAAATIFTVARIAGIVAHALEEYEHRLRFRPRATYVGPAPP
jgi:citrate synthase